MSDEDEIEVDLGVAHMLIQDRLRDQDTIICALLRQLFMLCDVTVKDSPRDRELAQELMVHGCPRGTASEAVRLISTKLTEVVLAARAAGK